MSLRQPLRQPLTLPAIAPSSWELKLPSYPVISGSWRSAAYPEVLGSIPSDAEWSLKFENRTSAEALSLLLPWTATGGGQWSLTRLPDEIAAGVDSESFRKRLLDTTWTIARKPQKDSVGNGRFNVTIVLVYELTIDSRYGPSSPSIEFGDNPVRIGVTGAAVVAGLPASLVAFLVTRPADLVLELQAPGGPQIAGLPISIDKTVRFFIADSQVLQIAQPGELSVAETPSELSVETPQFTAGGIIVEIAVSQGLLVPGVNPTR